MRNYGLKIIERAPEDYAHQLGASKIHKEVHRPDGNWVKGLPDGEIQIKRNIETMNCTNFGTNNALEIIEKVKFGTISNHSERALGIASDTTKEGNDPKKVAQTIHSDFGAVSEETLPFSDDIKNFEEYYSPKPLPKKIVDEGKKWLSQWDMNYEWVDSNPESLMEELQYAPLGVAVEAWQENSEGLYYGGENPNHWTLLVGYVEGKYWIIYDSYPETSGSYLKNLTWDYRFAMAMSYSLKKKSQEEVGSWWEEIYKALKVLFRIEKIY